jgi:hypothetical protein
MSISINIRVGMGNINIIGYVNFYIGDGSPLEDKYKGKKDGPIDMVCNNYGNFLKIQLRNPKSKQSIEMNRLRKLVKRGNNINLKGNFISGRCHGNIIKDHLDNYFRELCDKYDSTAEWIKRDYRDASSRDLEKECIFASKDVKPEELHPNCITYTFPDESMLTIQLIGEGEKDYIVITDNK